MSESRLNPVYTVLLLVFAGVLVFVGLKAGSPQRPLMPGSNAPERPNVPAREWRGRIDTSVKKAATADAPAATAGSEAAPAESPAPTAPGSDASPEAAAPVSTGAPTEENAAPAGGDEAWN